MPRRLSPVAIALAVCAALSLTAATTSSAPAPVAQYTADQAWQGRLTFILNCGECHGGSGQGWDGPALVGSASNIPWQSPKEVWGYMTAHMPVGNAGGLPKRDYVNIMAYLMQQAGRRSGKTPLTAKAIFQDQTPLDASVGQPSP